MILRENFSYPKTAMVAGVDEAGRGALVGNVVAAAVILPEQYDLPKLTDSKKLSPKQRELLFIQIRAQALSWSVACATPEEIDRLNIHYATLLAMQRAVEGLTLQPEMVRVDGKFAPSVSVPTETIIGGDASQMCIAAASVLAKVSRDRQLVCLEQRYPGYGFARHKGYGTKAHLAALQHLGATPEHRKSYAPVRAVLNTAE